MGLLSPWFLAGLAAVGLPIWMHLLKRHRTDPKPFPSVMFFEQREVSSVKHRRLEYLLLFALRVAMLILLALLFAEPFFNRTPQVSDNKKIVVVAVDQSFSMRAAGRLDKAKNEALSVLAKLTPGQTAQVLALGGRVQALTQLVSDPAELRAAVASIQPSDSRASFGELARYLRTLGESARQPIEVHLISDLQKSALPPGFADLRLDSQTALVFHPVGGPAANWTVESVIAPRRIYDTKKVRVQATVAGFGAPAAKRTVSLMLNGKTLQQKTVDVPAGGRASVEFLGLDAPYGFSKGEVRVDSADSLPADDRFLFATERTDPRKVMFLDDGRHPRALIYYRAALDASGDSAFQLETLHPEQGANIPLANYAFVVLNDPSSVGQNLEDALKRYVTAGGSLLIALGPSSVALPRVPVLDESIQTANYAGREGDRFLTAAEVDAGHPALRSVEKFAGVKFYQVVHVTPAKSTVLARMSDQTPLVMERKIGEGKVLVFASTFDNNSNDLPQHAVWVPFVQQSAGYLGGGGTEQPVTLTVDSYVELRASNSKGAAAEVLDPDGKRVLSLQEAATAKNFELSREGYYELTTASGRHSLIAVHADRRESDLTPLPQETLDLWRGTGAGDGSGQGSSNQQGDAARKPWGLWPVLMLLLLLVAIAESVVANGYLRPPSDEQEGAKKVAA